MARGQVFTAARIRRSLSPRTIKLIAVTGAIARQEQRVAETCAAVRVIIAPYTAVLQPEPLIAAVIIVIQANNAHVPGDASQRVLSIVEPITANLEKDVRAGIVRVLLRAIPTAAATIAVRVASALVAAASLRMRWIAATGHIATPV
jgi:hypothetical protein